MMSSQNPFVEDIEQRRPPRSPRPWLFEKYVPAFCTVLVGVIGIVALIYILAILDPQRAGSQEQDPYDVSRPVRRWPATSRMVNDSDISTADWSETTSIGNTLPETQSSGGLWNRSLMETPLLLTTTIDLDFTEAATEMETTSETSTAAGTNDLPNLDTFTTDEPKNQTPGTEQISDEQLERQLYSIQFPHIPPHSMCVPRKMDLNEYLDKQWYCYRCWQDVQNKTHTSPYYSEQQHRYHCHGNCYNNYAFHSCAIHLYQSPQYLPSHSVRKCSYCKRYMLDALHRGEHKP